jgi:hypothetical protein
MYYVQAIRKDIVKISGGAYHLKDLTTDKRKMLASKDSQGHTYDCNKLVNILYKLDEKILEL